MNTSTLTISPVTEHEDEYYCVVSNGGADGLLYKMQSRYAMVTVYGKIVYNTDNINLIVVALSFAP